MKDTPPKEASSKLVAKATKNLPVWARAGAENDILLGMGARITRNIAGIPFPGWSSTQDRQKVYQLLAPKLSSNKQLGISRYVEMTDLELKQRRLLLDRRYLSPCMAARQDGCFIGCSRQCDRIAFINEEEHLVLHCYADGTDPEGSFQRFHSLADSLDRSFTFAVDPAKGYLGSIPAEVGDGMQLYFFLHLPALTLAGTVDQLNRGAEKLLVSLSPLHPREETSGNCYILSAGPARYGTTPLMFSHLLEVAREIVTREWELRQKLLYTKLDELLDVVGRSYGLLSYAHRLNYNELLHHFSHLRLGASMDIIIPHELPSSTHFCEMLGEVMLELSPGTLAGMGITDDAEQERSRAHAVIHVLRGSGAELISPLITPEDFT